MKDTLLSDFYNHINNEQIRDLITEKSAIEKMAVRKIRYKALRVTIDGKYLLNLSGSYTLDISSIADLPVTHLCLQGCWGIRDFLPLRNMKLLWLNLSRTAIKDVKPLSIAPLEYLRLWHTKIESLQPLATTPLQGLDIRFSPIIDISPIKSMPLKELFFFPGKVESGLDVLSDIDTLERINGKPAQNFLKRYGIKKKRPKL